MNLNYTSICHYCGVIYKSNKSTSIYCCTKHNSLYHANGSCINYNILNNHGLYVNYYEILCEMYNTWTKEELHEEVKTDFIYDGPIPELNELLLVSGFIIRKPNAYENIGDIAIKPFQLLTKEERACDSILLPRPSHFINDHPFFTNHTLPI